MQNDQLFDRLLTEYFSYEISAEDKEELFSMVMESEFYKEQYEKTARLNALLHIPVFESVEQADYQLLKEKANIEENKLHSKRSFRKVALLRNIAAAMILVLVSSLGSVYFYKKHRNPEEHVSWVETATPLGGQTRLVLPDGSIVWINAKSQLKYDSRFGITERHIYLNGEAYFEVKKNEKQPFTVHGESMDVVATGTRFNTRIYRDDEKWEVNLLEGGVDVFVADTCFSLIPDEKIIYDKTSASAIVEKTDAHLAAQWTRGRLSFYQASIPEIYKMLERHFNVRIRIDSEELENEYFLGSINLEMSLSEILSYLDVDKEYKVELENDIIIVRKKRMNNQ